MVSRYIPQQTFVRCCFTKLRLRRVCSFAAMLRWSSFLRCLKCSNDCGVRKFDDVSVVVFWGVLLASDTAITGTWSELCDIDGEFSIATDSFSLSKSASDLSLEHGRSQLLLVADGDKFVERQGRFGVKLEVPYRLLRLRRWLKLRPICTHAFSQILHDHQTCGMHKNQYVEYISVINSPNIQQKIWKNVQYNNKIYNIILHNLRPTQLSIPPGLVNEYQLWVGRQRQVWFIAWADVRGVCRWNCEIPWELVLPLPWFFFTFNGGFSLA